MRLDKYLADMGLGTRSEVKQMIRKRRVLVNHTFARTGDLQIDAEADLVEVDGEAVAYAGMEYLLLNKPAGLISATLDSHQATVMDCVRTAREHFRMKDMAPVGRLDKDTTGLLLITNDGDLVHKLLAPGHHIEKEYLVETALPITEEMVHAFESGMDIPDSEKGNDAFHAKPALWRSAGIKCGYLTITEGKYHQVKRMFLAVGNEVTALKRVRMGELRLDETDLPEGSVRRLTEAEIAGLKALGTDEKIEN